MGEKQNKIMYFFKYPFYNMAGKNGQEGNALECGVIFSFRLLGIVTVSIFKVLISCQVLYSVLSHLFYPHHHFMKVTLFYPCVFT